MSCLSKDFRDICMSHWPGRSRRLLGVDYVAEKNTFLKYVELCAISSPQAVEFVERHMRGRILGRLNIGIEEFIKSGGNPADVAYGAASTGNRKLVDSLIGGVHQPYILSISEAAIRGSASTGHTRTCSVVCSGTVFREQVLGAVNSGSVEIVKRLYKNLRGVSRKSFLENLANAGRPDLVLLLDPESPPRAIQMAVLDGDWDKLMKITNKSEQHGDEACVALGRFGTMQLINRFLEIHSGLPCINTILKNAIYYHRYNVVAALSFPKNISPDDKLYIKNCALASGDMDFVNWATTV